MQSLRALTGRYAGGGRTGRSDVAIALRYVIDHPGRKRYAVVQALAAEHGIPMARSLEALRVLRERGDIDCDEGLCQAASHTFLR